MPDPAPLRVLRVMPMLSSAGTEVQCAEVLSELARGRAQYGVDVELATLYPRDGESVRIPSGTMIHELNVPRRGHAGILPASGRLSQLIPNYDVVHALLWPAIWAVALAQRGHAAFVASIHGSREQAGPLGIKRALDRALIHRAQRVVMNSAPGRDALASHFGLAPESILVIPNGKAPYSAPQPAPQRSGVLCMARFKAPKRQDLLLAACALLPAELRPTLRFMGYDTRSPDFLQLVAGSGLNASQVECLGAVEDPNPQLAAALISALPTEHEGLPNAILESWNTGAVVLASRVPGVQELVRDGEDGLLVDNTAQAWADGLRALLSDSALRERLAAAGRARFEREFSLEHTARAWAELYKSAAGR